MSVSIQSALTAATADLDLNQEHAQVNVTISASDENGGTVVVAYAGEQAKVVTNDQEVYDAHKAYTLSFFKELSDNAAADLAAEAGAEQ